MTALDHTAPQGDPQDLDRLERARLDKLHRIEQLGHDPWGHRYDGHAHIAAAREQAPAETGIDGETVRVAGRIMRWNDRGKLVFFHIQDYTGRIQVMASRGDLPDEQWQLLQTLDLGDLVGVDGTLRRTRTGEITVFLRTLTVLCKSLAQPPEKYHGAKDVETLLRQRYIDLIYNEGVLDRMLRRTRIIQSIRKTLAEREFFEVETPVLHAVAGGAAARPFITHHNALDIDLYLRIALELHLKRLMVGGIERVYEIGRVFRNEGIDATHNPEFTMIELYQAYGNYETMMDLTEALIANAARAALASPLHSHPQADDSSSASDAQGVGLGEGDRLLVQWGDDTIDFTPPFQRARYADLFREHAGCDMHDEAAVRQKALELIHAKVLPWELKALIETDAVHHDVLVNDVFEATVEDALAGPVFVIDYPASLCPLTKRKADDPKIAERFELFVRGMELANAYTELNDPRLQEDLFRTQLAGLSDEDSMAKMDHDFVRALKVGMPPAGGLGIGIDRLVMLLTGSRSIRDVIAFPAMRPERGSDFDGVKLLR